MPLADVVRKKDARSRSEKNGKQEWVWMNADTTALYRWKDCRGTEEHREWRKERADGIEQFMYKVSFFCNALLVWTH